MKPLRILLAVILLGAAGASAQDTDAETQWLVVVQGEVTEVSEAAISLAVPLSAIAFADRPERRVSLVNLEAFAANAWGENGAFRTDPPNASVIDRSSGTIAVITITDFGVADGIASLTIVLLEGALPRAGHVVALTIDAYPTAVNGQVTD